MRRKKLVNEITQFCLEYQVFEKTVNVDEVKAKIEIMLDDIAFIEILFNTIIRRAKKHDYFDVERLKKMLVEIEKIRLNLEYENINKLDKA